MKYKIVFHTPLGKFTSKIKDDLYEVIEQKSEAYCSNPTEGVSVTTDTSIVSIPPSVLFNSVIEFVIV